MLALSLILPLAAIVACLALSRAVPSRLLGLGAALLLLLAAAALVPARLAGELPATLVQRDWMVLGDRALQLELRLDAASWPAALIALAGGGLALAALALALPRDLRGFGGLLAALALAPLATVFGVASAEPLLTIAAWMVCALAGFTALRASGALEGSDASLVALVGGGGGALLGLGAVLVHQSGATGAPALAGGLVGLVALALIALGAPPLHAPLAAAAEAPAAVAAVIGAVGLPLLGGYVLLDAGAGLVPVVLPEWRAALVALGALALVASAAGALGTTRMRQIVAWQTSAQGGVLLMAAGLGGAALSTIGPAILAGMVVAALASFLALGALERRTGTDDLAALGARGPLAIPGAALLVAGASAAGLPGTLGFWTRLWLADELLRGAPWAVAPLLAGSTLLALSAIAPAAALWSTRVSAEEDEQPRRLSDAIPAVAALPLLLAGAAPAALMGAWLGPAQAALAPDTPPIPLTLPGTAGQIAAVAAAAALVTIPALAARGRRRPPNQDQEARVDGVIPPAALGHSTRGLAWGASPNSAIASIWDGIQWLSSSLSALLALFERRYYLAGLLIAMIVVILIFI